MKKLFQLVVGDVPNVLSVLAALLAAAILARVAPSLAGWALVAVLLVSAVWRAAA